MRAGSRSRKMFHLSPARRKVAITTAAIVFILMTMTLYRWGYQNEKKTMEDAYMAMSWEGFGPERGLYNFTVVTAMVDIGRGSWGQQRRTYNTYLMYMQRVLRLDVNMVVFVDAKGKPFIDWMRRGRENRTNIVVQDFKALPYYKLRGRMSEIMKSPEYQQDNELVWKQLCESYIPEYDILQLSKLYFMDRVVRDNPFGTTYFMWMDGGYGHGHDIHPSDGVWVPKGLFDHPDQVTFMERPPGVRKFEPVKHKIHKMSINILAGLFFAGGGGAFKELYDMQKKQVETWMQEGVVDDDQTMYMLLYYKKPSLFHLVPGDWYDVFSLFNSHVTR
ncbi:protein HtrL [Aplysia californica]|uniref:Protein HtrL n=1 Tax=Aplysia californica TaxID=6500 RepID=A0ABM1VVZ9_APLCA|nr:protein HtrL [Aplysia californica]